MYLRNSFTELKFVLHSGHTKKRAEEERGRGRGEEEERERGEEDDKEEVAEEEDRREQRREWAEKRYGSHRGKWHCV